MLGKKRKRDISKGQNITLKIGKTNENFELISYKLKKAKELFLEYEGQKTKKEKWELINKIVELVEINPEYIMNFSILIRNLIKKIMIKILSN